MSSTLSFLNPLQTLNTSGFEFRVYGSAQCPKPPASVAFQVFGEQDLGKRRLVEGLEGGRVEGSGSRAWGAQVQEVDMPTYLIPSFPVETTHGL